MKKLILAGATDQTLDVFIQDSTSTTGGGKTGLAYNTASLTCYYRKGATGSATALSLATQTVGGAHSDGGFVEIDSTNMPGMYRLDLSDTIIATAGTVSLMLKGATGMAPLPIELQVVAVNLNDGVRMGLTALPNAAADAAGGLPISDAGGLDLDTVGSNVAAVLADTGTDGVVVASGSKTGYSLTATTGLGNQTANITGNLSGSVGSVTGAVGSVTGAVGSVTGNVGGNVAGSVASVTGDVGGNVDGTVAGVTPATAAQVAAVLTTQITESYRANAAAPTLAQFMSEVLAHLGEVSISGTTKTINKLDHTTAAATFTLDDATTPAAITRAT